MSILSNKKIDELRTLQSMADKGFAAWTNENFQDLLDTYDNQSKDLCIYGYHTIECLYDGEVDESCNCKWIKVKATLCRNRI